MLPWTGELAGRLDVTEIDSVRLRDNVLGDPALRPLWVYLPPGYDAGSARYPTLYVLQGWGLHVTMWANRSAHRRPLHESYDALVVAGQAPPAVLVFVDGWTAYGGSQFVDSPGTGRYHSYLCEEVVALVDARYRTLADPAHRGIAGWSSGGFGSLVSALWRPDLFGALASHAGDSLYEYVYVPNFARWVRMLRRHQGDIGAWWAGYRAARASGAAVGPDREFDDLGMLLGVAAAFSADPDGTPRLPFDPVTGLIRDDVWARWLDLDPVRMIPKHAAAAAELRAVWLDAGARDEWFLDLGTAAVRTALLDAGLPADRIAYERVQGGHNALEPRFPAALAWLAERLAG